MINSESDELSPSDQTRVENPSLHSTTRTRRLPYILPQLISKRRSGKPKKREKKTGRSPAVRSSEKEAKRATPDGVSEDAFAGGGRMALRWSELEAKRAKLTGGDGGGCGLKSKEAEAISALSGEVGVVEEGFEWRWSEASPEILAVIFAGRMAADEVARTVPLVCRGWRQAAAGQQLWGEVDIEAWCRRVCSTDKADVVVRRLVRRARGVVSRLSAYCVGDDAFGYAATCGKSLNVLQIPMSDVSDQTLEKHAEYLPVLRVLDISCCVKITSTGIQAIGRHCKSLVHLKRNMPPPAPTPSWNNAAAVVVEEEAMAIANSMPGMEQLELAYGRFSDLGLDAILTKCPKLRSLNVLGCWNVKLEGDIEDRFCALESYREPWESIYPDFSSNEEDEGEDDSDDEASESDD